MSSGAVAPVDIAGEPCLALDFVALRRALGLVTREAMEWHIGGFRPDSGWSEAGWLLPSTDRATRWVRLPDGSRERLYVFRAGRNAEGKLERLSLHDIAVIGHRLRYDSKRGLRGAPKMYGGGRVLVGRDDVDPDPTRNRTLVSRVWIGAGA